MRGKFLWGVYPAMLNDITVTVESYIPSDWYSVMLCCVMATVTQQLQVIKRQADCCIAYVRLRKFVLVVYFCTHIPAHFADTPLVFYKCVSAFQPCGSMIKLICPRFSQLTNTSNLADDTQKA